MKKAPMTNLIKSLPIKSGIMDPDGNSFIRLVMLTACDDFTRFRNEQYLCLRTYGINEMIINSAKVGDFRCSPPMARSS